MSFLSRLIKYKVARTSAAPLSTLLAASVARGISLTGTYTGNGTSQTPLSSLPGKPTFVVVKADSASYTAVFACSSNFLSRTDYLGGTESTGGAITLTDTGFSVGAAGEVNANAVTYHYAVYIDNGANGIIDVSWQGNGVAGRTMDLLSGRAVAGMIIKRDAAQNCVYAIKGYGAYDWMGPAGLCPITRRDGYPRRVGVGQPMDGP
jgi:hypothetical protein